MSKFAVIIRMEEASVNGRGMYGAISVDLHLQLCDENHPSPEDDIKLSNALYQHEFPNLSDWYFGFSSKKAARAWLYKAKWLHQLHEEGIVVSEYTCKKEHIIKGDSQSIFFSHESKVSYNILSYFGLKEKPPCPSTASPTHSATRGALADVSSIPTLKTLSKRSTLLTGTWEV